MKTEAHRLTKVDLEAKTAVCAVCGPVQVIIKKRANGSPRPRCKVLMSQQAKKYRKTPGGKAAIKIQRQRTVSPDHGLTYVEAQKYRDSVGCCEICGSTRFLTVDHSHATGKVRGVLCRRCNLGVGYFKDDVGLLKLAKKYLEDRE